MYPSHYTHHASRNTHHVTHVTHVKSAVSVETRIAVTLIAGAVLGFAAYGFGLLPSLRDDSRLLVAPTVSCPDHCQTKNVECRAQGIRPTICDAVRARCVLDCAAAKK